MVINYLKDSYNEFKNVKWPSRNEALRLTAYVIGGSLAVGLFVTILDYIFKELLIIIIGA